MTWKPDICIHHYPCDDGFGAAWAVWKRWGDDVEFRPTNYGQPVPNQYITDKHILIADFSFKPDVLMAMAERAHSIVLLDHHRTAEADLAEFPRMAPAANAENIAAEFEAIGENVIATFDMERSGASLTWDFCHPAEPQPALIKYIEDRDLWRFRYSETRALSLLLRSYPYDFMIWTDLMRRFESKGNSLFAEAGAIQRFYDRKLGELIPNAVRWITVGGHKVPALNVPWGFASDAANRLLYEYPDVDFAVAYFENGDGKGYSLRSEDDRADVSVIARAYGGGGHRNAAGFRVPV